MKDFMLIFKGTHYDDLGLSPEEQQQRLGKWWEWTQKLEAQGVLTGGDALKNGHREISGPDRIVSDRTTVGMKDVIGGYFMVKVNDIDAATKIAQDYPDFDTPGGAVEIREVQKYEY